MKNYFDVKGKNAIVTGASSGLGKQFALCLAEQGANVAIAARRVERLEELKPQIEAYGVKCLVLPCDVTDTTQIKAAAEKTFKEFGCIDILINNAAAGFATPAIECDDETWEKTMQTNLTYSPIPKGRGFWYQQTLRSCECLTGSPPMVDAPTTFTTKTFSLMNYKIK